MVARAIGMLLAAAAVGACGGEASPATGESLVASLVADDQCADGTYSGPNIKEFIADEVTTWVVLTELDDQSQQLIRDAPTGVSAISGTGRANLVTAASTPFTAEMVHLMMPGLSQALRLLGQVDIIFGLGRVAAGDALPLVMVAIVIDRASSAVAFLGQCSQLLTRAWAEAADGHPADLLRSAVGKTGLELETALGVAAG
jgi:hypothetical protein